MFQQVKDLKRQLNAERKRADQLQGKLQDFIQEIKVKQSKELFQFMPLTRGHVA